MKKEITTSGQLHGNDTAFWRRRNVYGNKPLTIHHIVPPFIVLGLGLLPSIIIFILELLLSFYKRKMNTIHS